MARMFLPSLSLPSFLLDFVSPLTSDSEKVVVTQDLGPVTPESHVPRALQELGTQLAPPQSQAELAHFHLPITHETFPPVFHYEYKYIHFIGETSD